MTVSLLTDAVRRRIERAETGDVLALAQTLSREICARYARACRLADVIAIADALDQGPDDAPDTNALAAACSLRMNLNVARLARMNPDVASAIGGGELASQGWQAVARVAVRLRADEIATERASRAGDRVNAETQAAADAGEV